LKQNKCVFGVPSGQLLGFLVSNQAIEASTKQIRAITEMAPPCCVKDVQKLIESMAALNRFISRLDEKGLPFFKLLKKTYKFEWTEDAKEAFESLKVYLTSSPILMPPKKNLHDVIHIGNIYCGQRNNCGRKRRRVCIQGTAASILHQRDSDRLKNTVPVCTKTTLRPPNHFSQATTLLRKATRLP
jgi:hypothetical protein